jgi:putative Mn2+ efflux pump MntP
VFERDERKDIILNNITLLSLAFLVSIDSFIAGIGINNIDNRHLLNSITFSLFSFSFSFIALKIGKYINLKLGSVSKIVAAILLIVLSITHLTKS